MGFTGQTCKRIFQQVMMQRAYPQHVRPEISVPMPFSEVMFMHLFNDDGWGRFGARDAKDDSRTFDKHHTSMPAERSKQPDSRFPGPKPE